MLVSLLNLPIPQLSETYSPPCLLWSRFLGISTALEYRLEREPVLGTTGNYFVDQRRTGRGR